MRKLLQFRNRVSAVSLWMLISLLFSTYLVGPWSPLPKHFTSSAPYLKPEGPAPEWIDYQTSAYDQREGIRKKLRNSISLEANNATIDQMVRSISEQIDVPIEYFSSDDQAELNNGNLRFNCSWERIEAHMALRRTLERADFSWEIHENIIYIVNQSDTELVFRIYDLAWLMQNDAQSDEVLEFVHYSLLEPGDAELFGSRLVAKASEQQHLKIEEFLASLQGLCPTNSRQLSDSEDPQNSPAYCGGGFF